MALHPIVNTIANAPSPKPVSGMINKLSGQPESYDKKYASYHASPSPATIDTTRTH